jgi:hypothetical protein
VALRWEQWEQLESNHHENRATGKEGEADYGHHKHVPSEKKKWQYACRLFETNSHKVGAMSHIDLLLGNDHGISKCTTAVSE